MNDDNKTIRLQNTQPSNLSLQLAHYSPAAAGSLRRGPTITPVVIPAGRYYDVCKELGVSYPEALQILRRSPEVQKFKAAGKLAEIVFPPEPEAPKAEDEAEGEGEDKAASTAEQPNEGGAKEAYSADKPNPGEASAGQGMPPMETDDPGATMDLSQPRGDTPRDGEPSMDWSEEDLRAFAETRGVDVSGARSKTAVLRSIRGAK